MRKREVKGFLEEFQTDQKILHWYEKLGGNFYYYYLKTREFFTRKPTIAHFVYETNTQCTLRCKECHSYMPHFTKESHYMVNFENFKSEIDKLLKSVDFILSFRLQGGETLLVKDLAKIVEYACSKKQIQHIQIISNGTIIPTEELLKAMQNPKVLLFLSDYSINEDVLPKCKHNDIIKLCEEYNINYKHAKAFARDYWVARVEIAADGVPNKELSVKNLKQCVCFATPKAFILFKGKIFICAPSVYYYSVNPNFKFPKDEMVDVMNSDIHTTTLLIKKIINKKVYDLCARCDLYQKSEIRHIPGEQLKKVD